MEMDCAHCTCFRVLKQSLRRSRARCIASTGPAIFPRLGRRSCLTSHARDLRAIFAQAMQFERRVGFRAAADHARLGHTENAAIEAFATSARTVGARSQHTVTSGFSVWPQKSQRGMWRFSDPPRSTCREASKRPSTPCLDRSGSIHPLGGPRRLPHANPSDGHSRVRDWSRRPLGGRERSTGPDATPRSRGASRDAPTGRARP